MATTFAGWAGLSGSWGWHTDDGIDDQLFDKLAHAGRLTVDQMAPLAAQIVHHDTAEIIAGEGAALTIYLSAGCRTAQNE